MFGILTAEDKSPDKGEVWGKRFKEKSGPDGHCEHRPIIQQVIAALCVYNNQFLGKLITKLASDQDGIDLTIQADAEKWFKQKITIQDDCFSNLLLVYESLVRAFYFRQNRSQGREVLWGFPREPPAQTPLETEPESESDIEPSGWDDAEEVRRWEASL